MSTSVRDFKIPMKDIVVPLLSSMVLVVVVFVFFDVLGRHAAALRSIALEDDMFGGPSFEFIPKPDRL
jgi:hypothetical protein